MFPRKNRVSRNDFASLLKEGRTIKSHHFKVRFQVNKEGDRFFSVVAPARLFKKAVTRNKVRRRVRSVVRENTNFLPASIRIALFVEKDIKDIVKSTLNEEIQKLFKEVK